MTYSMKYSHERFFNVIDKLNRSTTKEIAEEVGCDKRIALIRLRFMASKKLIKCEKRGVFFYWERNDDVTYDDYLAFLAYIKYHKNNTCGITKLESFGLEKFRTKLRFDEKKNPDEKENSSNEFHLPRLE